MHSIVYRIAAPAALTLFTAQGAFADLTAADVWADWKAYLGSIGYTIDGQEDATGKTVTINNLVLSQSDEETGMTARMEMGTLSFTESGNGAIRIEMAETMPLQFAVTENAPMTMAMTYTQSGLDITASGSPEDITYTYQGDSVKIVLDEFSVEDEEAPDSIELMLDMQGLSGTTTSKTADTATYAQDLKATAVVYDIAMKGIEVEGDGFAAAGTLNNVTFGGTMLLPAGLDMTKMQDAVKKGLDISGQLAFTDGNGTSEVTGPDGNFSATAKSGGGALEIDMSKDGLKYAGFQTASEVAVQVDGLPFPLSYSVEKTEGSILFPIVPSDEDQDFSALINLQGLSVSDGLWNLFDPGETLSRDPANLKIDVAGAGKLQMDFLDPAIDESDFEEAPGELTSLNLNALLLEIAGAKLTGTGAFAFTYPEDAGSDAVPDAAGAVDLALTGGNTLMDKLVAMGLLPEENAMAARMMMGLFTEPGEGEDSLKSRIEITEEGHILANGSRIK